jgi:carboxymethylenebutenolidase
METFTVARQSIRIERFAPKTPGPHRAVLVMHGADGLPGRGLPYRELAARVAEHDYVTFLPHYFDATGGQPRPNPLNPMNFMAWMNAIGEAIGYALRQSNVLEGQIGLIGFSLGGYLSVAVGANDERVGAIVECCGGLPEMLVPDVRAMPPVLILHGGADPIVPVSEAHKLERLLQEHDRPHEVWIYPGRDHQLTGVDFEDASSRSLTFLRRHLKSKTASPPKS